MSACSISAGVVEQSLSNVLPDGMRCIEPHRVSLLNFDDARTTSALDAEHMSGNFRQAALLDWQPRLSSGARIAQHGVP
jgi:hypothetical protein